MVFRRRTKRTYLEVVVQAIYPKGGWRRAAQYVQHRLRRLPDEPHRIARGLFVGIFVSFTPLFGFHLLLAAAIAVAARANVVAALLATLVGNPVTFPFIAVLSVELGRHLLGIGEALPAWQIIAAFGLAGAEFWANVHAMFTDEPTRWPRLALFFRNVFLPYLVGGIIPGIAAGLAGYWLSLPVLGAYQKLRRKRAAERAEKKLRRAKAKTEQNPAADPQAGDDAAGQKP